MCGVRTNCYLSGIRSTRTSAELVTSFLYLPFNSLILLLFYSLFIHLSFYLSHPTPPPHPDELDNQRPLLIYFSLLSGQMLCPFIVYFRTQKKSIVYTNEEFWDMQVAHYAILSSGSMDCKEEQPSVHTAQLTAHWTQRCRTHFQSFHVDHPSSDAKCYWRKYWYRLTVICQKFWLCIIFYVVCTQLCKLLETEVYIYVIGLKQSQQFIRECSALRSFQRH